MTKVEEIIAQLETLTPDERAIVADAAWCSLGKPNEDVMAKWVHVARIRLEELRSGVVEGIPAEEVLEELERDYPHR